MHGGACHGQVLVKTPGQFDIFHSLGQIELEVDQESSTMIRRLKI